MGKKELLLLIVGFMFSSCFALHPELQQAESLDKGENAHAGGLYGGAYGLSSISGVAGLHNYGLTDYVDWSTDVQKITNYIKIQSYPGALTPHTTGHLLNRIDTANKTSTIDSAGIIIDESNFVLRDEKHLSFSGTDQTIDWAFDTDPLPVGLEPIFDSHRGLVSGEQTFDIQLLNRKDYVLYFDTVVPVYYAGTIVNVELRHTQHWKK